MSTEDLTPLDAEQALNRWMDLAFEQAQQAAALGEVPVGAVLTSGSGADEQLLAHAHNRSIVDDDPTAHAEILALRQAAIRMGNYRLPDTTLYVTLEPCMMCVGAIVHARVERLVCGALEPKSGAVISHPLIDSGWLNHRVEVLSGVQAERCGHLMSEFFRARRSVKRAQGNPQEK